MNFQDVAVLCEVDIDGPWLAGGSVRKHLQKEEQDADYDIYFKTEAQAEYLINIFDEEYGVTTSSSWARNYKVDGVDVQLIIGDYYKDPLDCIAHMCFTVCQFIYDGKEFKAGKTSKQDVKDKLLKISNGDRKSAILFFSQKYIAKGYRFTPEAIAALTGDTVKTKEELESYAKKEKYKRLYGHIWGMDNFQAGVNEAIEFNLRNAGRVWDHRDNRPENNLQRDMGVLRNE